MRLVLALLLLALLSSCSRRSDGLSMIPEEAPVVVGIDIIELAQKAKYKDWDELEFMKFAKEEMANESVRLSRRLEDIAADPMSAGIDIFKKVYVFSAGKKQDYAGIVFDLKDRDDFEEFIKVIFSEADIPYEHKKVNEHRVFMLNGSRRSWMGRSSEGALVYDKKRLIWIIPQGYSSRNDMVDIVRDITALGSRHQLIKNKRFGEFVDNVKDISVWVNGEALTSQLPRREVERLQEMAGYDLKDNSIQMDLEFEKNKIVLNSDYQLGENLSRFMNQWGIFDQEIEEDLLEMLPGNALAAATVSFDIEAMEQAIREDTLFAELRNESRRQFGDEALFDDMLGSLSAFTGDAAIDVYKLETYMEEYRTMDRVVDSLGNIDYGWVTKEKESLRPLIAMSLGVKDRVKLDSLVAEFTSNEEDETNAEEEEYPYRSSGRSNSELLTKVGDHFQFEIGSNRGFVFYDDEALLITNDSTLLAQHKSGDRPSTSLDDADYSDEIDENSMFVCFELDQAPYQNIIEEEVQEREQKFVEMVDGFTKRLTMSAKGPNSQFVLEAHPGEGNTLWRIIKLADEAYNESRGH